MTDVFTLSSDARLTQQRHILLKWNFFKERFKILGGECREYQEVSKKNHKKTGLQNENSPF